MSHFGAVVFFSLPSALLRRIRPADEYSPGNFMQFSAKLHLSLSSIKREGYRSATGAARTRIDV